MKKSIIRKWARLLQTESCFEHHFVHRRPELAEALLDEEAGGPARLSGLLKQIVKQTTAEPASEQAVIDSLFSLRDIVKESFEKADPTESAAVNLRRIQHSILQLTLLFQQRQEQQNPPLKFLPASGDAEAKMWLDHHFRINDLDQNCLDILRCSREEARNQSILHFFPHKSHKLLMRSLKKLEAREKRSVEIQLAAINANGHEFMAGLQVHPAITGTPDPGYQVSLHDLSYNEDTNHLLTLMLLALENVGEGIIVTEPYSSGRILFVNRTLESMSGYSRDELHDKDFSKLTSNSWKNSDTAALIGDAQHGGWMGDIMFGRKDGSGYPVSMNVQPIPDQDGSPIAMVFVIRDVTEREIHQRSIVDLQKLVSGVINNLHDYILVTESDFRILFWNQALINDSGINAQDAVGMPLFQLLPALKSVEIDRVFVQEKQAMVLFGTDMKHYHVSIRPLFGESRPNLLLWVIRGIHEEELLKAKITWQNERLKQIGDIAGLLNATPDIHETVRTFSQELRHIVPFKAMHVFLPLDSSNRFFRLYFSSRERQAVFHDDIILNLETMPLFHDLLQAYSPRRLNMNAANGSNLPLRLDPDDVIFGYPITVARELIGIMVLAWDRPQAPGAGDRVFLEKFVTHLAVAMKNRLQFDQIEKRTQKLNLIHTIFEDSRGNKSRDVIIRNALQQIAETFNYDHLIIYRWSKDHTADKLAAYTTKNSVKVKFPATINTKSLPDRLPHIWLDLQSPSYHSDLLGAEVVDQVNPRFSIALKEKSHYYDRILLLGFCRHYLPEFSYHDHINNMERVLRELIQALDHAYLFNKTKSAERAWKTTFNEVQIGLAVVDHNYAITRANRYFWQALNLFNARPGLPIEWNKLLHVDRKFDNISKTDKTPTPDNVEAIEWLEEESQRLLRRRFFPFPTIQGQFKGGIFTVQDITEERERQEYIRFLSRFPEINPSIILNVTETGEVNYCNPAGMRIVGSLDGDLSPAESLLPRPFRFELEQKKFTPDAVHEYNHVLNDRVYQFITFQPGGEDTIYLYGTDITDRLDLQEKLVRTERVRAMGEMAAGVAHDFNNLLTTILGRTQLLLLEKGKLDPRKQLEVIEKAAKDGAGIVKRLQSVNKKDREKDFRSVYLKDLLQDSLLFASQKLKPDTQIKGKATRINAQFTNNLVVYGNPIELKEAFTNLFFNAFDAMPKGGELTIESRRRDTHSAEILISDTGMGMPEKIVQKIFDPFFTTKGARGTGLGLALVYNIITAHKGTVEVASEPDKGTTFLIHLPLSTATPAENSDLNPPVISAGSDTSLLVVDDEPELLDMIAEILRLKYSRVDMANSGETALEQLSKRDYDIVLTDLGMPGVSGWEVARNVKEKHPESRVILVTGWGMQAENELKHHEYVDKVISKPYELHHLIRIIEEMTNGNNVAAKDAPSA